jgi:hypothetical protein
MVLQYSVRWPRHGYLHARKSRRQKLCDKVWDMSKKDVLSDRCLCIPNADRTKTAIDRCVRYTKRAQVHSGAVDLIKRRCRLPPWCLNITRNAVDDRKRMQIPARAPKHHPKHRDDREKKADPRLQVQTLPELLQSRKMTPFTSDTQPKAQTPRSDSIVQTQLTVVSYL